jgi:hypothetical protein
MLLLLSWALCGVSSSSLPLSCCSVVRRRILTHYYYFLGPYVEYPPPHYNCHVAV